MEVIINNPIDMHLHLRQDEMLEKITYLSSENFSDALIMPNTNPPITNKKQLDDYYEKIIENKWNNNFQPHLTLFFNENLNYDSLKKIKDKIIAIKLYPAWITTNSKWWVEEVDIGKLWHIFQAMSDLKIPLCVHWETNWFVMDREGEFTKIYEQLASNFPGLKIIMEHITTKEAANLLDKYENLHATVTLHHLMMTLDDVVWWLMIPHNFCKPIAKRPEDKQELRKKVFQAHPKIMFGSDSAPHPVDKKESYWCAAGVFTSPIALQMLTQLFEDYSNFENLQKFVSENAQNIYNITPVNKKVILEKTSFQVPNKYYDVVPFKSWEKINWSIKEVVQ